jgi:very-long-chain (3R)-3-hydroxyacyl-CoA dehydratase
MENQTSRRPSANSYPSRQSSKQQYLLAYNGFSLFLWTIVTLRAAFLIPTLLAHSRLEGLFEALSTFLKWTQTLALLEVIHSLIGLVRASPITTAMQVASRILVVWGVLYLYPEVVAKANPIGRIVKGAPGGTYAFAGILMAWGITEVIRYGYFVYREGISSNIPPWLTWLRYNTFFVLYPIGISSECWLMWLALKPAKKEEKGMDWMFKAVLFIYVPGSYILYTHMMAQRRKVMKGKGKVT